MQRSSFMSLVGSSRPLFSWRCGLNHVLIRLSVLKAWSLTLPSVVYIMEKSAVDASVNPAVFYPQTLSSFLLAVLQNGASEFVLSQFITYCIPQYRISCATLFERLKLLS